MVKGLRYADYLDQQKEDYEDGIKVKKEAKARMKQVELSNEAHFGSKAKRKNVVGTPSKLNSKMQRVSYLFLFETLLLLCTILLS